MEIGDKRLLWLRLIILPCPRDGMFNLSVHREFPFLKRNLGFIPKVQHGPIIDGVLSRWESIILILLINFTSGNLTAVQGHFLFGLNDFWVNVHMTLFVPAHREPADVSLHESVQVLTPRLAARDNRRPIVRF